MFRILNPLEGGPSWFWRPRNIWVLVTLPVTSCKTGCWHMSILHIWCGTLIFLYISLFCDYQCRFTMHKMTFMVHYNSAKLLVWDSGDFSCLLRVKNKSNK